MASLFIDVHLSNAKLTVFCDSNCFIIVSTVNEYSLQKMLLRVVAGGSTRSLRNFLSDPGHSRFDTVFHGLCAETNPKMW